MFCNWLLMYLEDVEVEKLFVNMLRWLRPNGYLFFRESCYHSSGLLWWCASYLIYWTFCKQLQAVTTYGGIEICRLYCYYCYYCSFAICRLASVGQYPENPVINYTCRGRNTIPQLRTKVDLVKFTNLHTDDVNGYQSPIAWNETCSTWKSETSY